MFSHTPRIFTVAAVGLSTTLLAAVAGAQTMPVPALPPEDTLRTQDDELAQDSRVGGALARESEPADAPAPQGESTPRVRQGEGEVISGEVVTVSGNELVLTANPEGKGDEETKSPEETMTIQVGDMTQVTRNGEEAEVSAISTGDDVQIFTAPGDASIALQILAYSDHEGSLNVIHGTPHVDPDKARQNNAANRQRQVRLANNREEAVLPLGIEVFGVRNDALVTEMLTGGPSAAAGVRVGDLILAINGQPITNTEQIEQGLATQPGPVELTIKRGSQRMTITVTPAGKLTKNAIVNTAGLRRAFNGLGITPAVQVPVGNGTPVVPAAGLPVDGTPDNPSPGDGNQQPGNGNQGGQQGNQGGQQGNQQQPATSSDQRTTAPAPAQPSAGASQGETQTQPQPRTGANSQAQPPAGAGGQSATGNQPGGGQQGATGSP